MGMIEARMPSEEKSYARTGRIVDAKVEADGDIHLALEDATGNNLGTVSAEIPVGRVELGLLPRRYAGDGLLTPVSNVSD